MKAFKIIVLFLFGGFLLLFFSYKNGYYQNLNKEKMLLTEEKIQEYEDDLQNGVDVTNKDYIVITPSYDNVYTRKMLGISSIIEDSLNGIIRYIFKKLGSIVDE